MKSSLQRKALFLPQLYTTGMHKNKMHGLYLSVSPVKSICPVPVWILWYDCRCIWLPIRWPSHSYQESQASLLVMHSSESKRSKPADQQPHPTTEQQELTRPATRQRLQPVRIDEAWEPGCKHKHRKGPRRTLRVRVRTAKGGAGRMENSYLKPFHLRLCCEVYSSWVIHLSLLFAVKSSRSWIVIDSL